MAARAPTGRASGASGLRLLFDREISPVLSQAVAVDAPSKHESEPNEGGDLLLP